MVTGGWRRLVMTKGAMGQPLHRAALVLVCLGVLCACTTAERTISRPTIAPGTDWKVEHCLGRLCPRAEDALVANDLRVRIETSVGTKSGVFRVTVDFFSKPGEIEFDPSAATATLNGGKTLRATGLSCSRKPSDLSDGESAAPSKVPPKVREVLCFHLIFDSPPPAVTEEFVVRLDGITRKGVAVRVPDIVFRPHVKSVPRSLLD